VLISTKISKCPKCQSFLKTDEGIEVWLKIRENELKGKEYEDTNYINFFKISIRNHKLDQLRKRNINLEFNENIEVIEEIQDSKFCFQDVMNFINEKEINETDLFLKNLLYLRTKMSARQISKHSGISVKIVLKYLKIAYDDFINFMDNN
jgi:hypothetical protein